MAPEFSLSRYITLLHSLEVCYWPVKKIDWLIDWLTVGQVKAAVSQPYSLGKTWLPREKMTTSRKIDSLKKIWLPLEKLTNSENWLPREKLTTSG